MLNTALKSCSSEEGQMIFYVSISLFCSSKVLFYDSIFHKILNFVIE